MSRNRLTQRNANRRNKVADPYTMHQDRVNPPVEKYMNGDPSAWAEDLHPIPPAGTPRNSIGLPEFLDTTWDHKDADMWNDGAAYDNSDTFDASDDQGRRLEASRRQRRFAALQKKADRCIRIAEFLFPASSDRVVEAQALDLMGLSDRAVAATLARLAEESGEEDEKEAAEEEDDKESSRRQAARRNRRAEEDDEDEKAAKKSRKSKKSEDEEDDVEASEDDEDEKESKKSRKSKKAEDDEDEKESKKSRKSKKSEDEDEDHEASEDDEDDVEASDDEEDEKESKKSRKSKKAEDEKEAKKSRKSKKSEDEEEEKESKRKSKKASKAAEARRLMAQLRNLLSEDGEDEDHEASEDGDDEVEAMLSAMGMDSEEEDHESDMHEDMESYMDEDASMEDLDAEMHRLMNEDGEMSMDADMDDMMLNDLMLEPEVDPLPGLMGDDEDLVLAQLTNRSAKKASKAKPAQAPKKNGVKSLGRVTTASADNKEKDLLSRLWTTDPDVSKTFKS